jgi:hypothetical protein
MKTLTFFATIANESAYIFLLDARDIRDTDLKK